ncbi:hypothetical protein Xtri_19130 [Xanthomonas campestris pv. trichodesmae]|uniref:Uncharacterized protein n=2 Tax=Xanthomonas citri TaxID=346 RepID=A0AB33CEF4_XANCI|nr:hypothetical protein XcvCFBP7111P_03140 [Xanthomonas citri pv. vignicola]MBZ3921819.1 hypothetical protein [Xanthomonas campestris pv. trichodesmae]MBZ3926480.1 hypothetical protein [Xanthomonas citri pv. sesbaniae]
MARCRLYFEPGVNCEHDESRMAHGAPQARGQHRDAGPAGGGARDALRVRIRSARLLFPHFPGSQP